MHIDFENILNTRDLGGLPAADGRRIKPGMLFRSGKPSDATEADIEKLKSLGITKIVDFRTEDEVKEAPDPEVEGIEIIHLDVLPFIAAGVTRDRESNGRMQKLFDGTHKPEDGLEMMLLTYKYILTEEHPKRAYRRFLEEVLGNDSGATLWHCTAGKDRAGLGTVLVQECLGVPRDFIRLEYMITNIYLKEDVDRKAGRIRERGGSETDAEILRHLWLARKPYIDWVYEYVDENYGGFAGYLERELGAGPGFIAAMREKFLE